MTNSAPKPPTFNEDKNKNPSPTTAQPKQQDATFARVENYGQKDEPISSSGNAGGMLNEASAQGSRSSSSTEDGNR